MRTQRRMHTRHLEQRASSTYAQKLERAEELGFTGRAAALMAGHAVLHPGCTVGQLVRFLAREYPGGVFDASPQLSLFDEGVVV